MLSPIEQRLLESVDVSLAWSLLENICSFSREHPADVDRAVEMVAGQLRDAGVPAEVGQMHLYLSLPGSARVEVNGQTFRAKTASMSVSVPAGLRAKLMYVPGQKDMIASLLEPDQNAGGLRERIAGCIVVTEGFGGPGVVSTFAPLGAVGVIAINPGKDIHSAICTPIWGSPQLRQLKDKPALPVLSVNQPDGETLKQLAANNAEAHIFSELQEGWFPSKYLSVEIRGTVEPQRFVMLHGHIDTWHLGVGDNSTGVVTMFEVARRLWAERANLRRSVRILWWPGHSTGRYAGSTWYADQHAIDIAENCVAQINCDSPGCRWATVYDDLFCMPEAVSFLSTAVKDATGLDGRTMRPFRAADWSFNNLGVTGILALSSTMPAALVAEKNYYRTGGNGGNIEWHTDRDTMEIADREILARDMQLYSLATFRAATAELLPLDFRPAVQEHRQALETYQEAAKEADLRPAFQACDELADALARFYKQIELGGLLHETANEAIIALARALVPAHFSNAPRFQQDPALDMPPLPAIALAARVPKLRPEEVPFALVEIKRGSNQIVAAFRTAVFAVEAALATVSEQTL